MIQATPQYPQDLCLEVLEKLKDLKEELANISLRQAPSSSCAYCGGPHNDDQCQPSGFDTSTPPQIPLIQQSRGKSMEELLAEEHAARDERSMEELLVLERAAITRSKFHKAALLDEDVKVIMMIPHQVHQLRLLPWKYREKRVWENY